MDAFEHLTTTDEFIAEGAEGEENDYTPRAAVNARLNLERELNDQDLQKIAAGFNERYRQRNVRYTGDMNEVPQRLLMPSVHDANLWQVRCKVEGSHGMNWQVIEAFCGAPTSALQRPRSSASRSLRKSHFNIAVTQDAHSILPLPNLRSYFDSLKVEKWSSFESQSYRAPAMPP